MTLYNQDEIAPTVKITSPNTTNLYKRGTDLRLVARFKDNGVLKNCKITIKYISALPGFLNLKGIGSPWSPAENNDVHTLIFNGSHDKKVNVKQLFDVPIEAACLSGIYRLTLITSDDAKKPTLAQKQ